MHNLYSIRPYRFSFKQQAVRASLSLLALAVFGGPLCNPAFAATRVASLVVSLSVAPSCQVGANATAAAAPVSVNCNMPVSYQVQVSGSSSIQPANESSRLIASLASAGSPQSHGFETLQSNRAAQAAATPEQDLSGLAALAETATGVATVNGPADGTDTHAVTVTIVY